MITTSVIIMILTGVRDSEGDEVSYNSSTLLLGQFVDYVDLMPAIDERTLPPDLMYINKTERELELEECMENYAVCIRSIRGKSVCASSRQTRQKATFETFCEMHYENCKEESRTWEYFHDGECYDEFI